LFGALPRWARVRMLSAMDRPPACDRQFTASRFRSFLASFVPQRGGSSAVEYALLFVGILLVVAAGYRVLGKGLKHAATVAEATFHGNAEYTSGNGNALGGGGITSGSGGGDSICDGRSCGAPGACFVAGTLVATPEGARPIESLRAGDLVLARGAPGGDVQPRSIATTYIRPAHSLVDVHVMTVDGAREAIRCTVDHLYFTSDLGWMGAADLRAGQTLLDSAGREVQVTRVMPIAQEAWVYNFEVDVDHTYFVGRSEVWVHNPDGCGPNNHSDNTTFTGPVTGPVLGNGGGGGAQASPGQSIINPTNSHDLSLPHEFHAGMFNDIAGDQYNHYTVPPGAGLDYQPPNTFNYVQGTTHNIHIFPDGTQLTTTSTVTAGNTHPLTHAQFGTYNDVGGSQTNHYGADYGHDLTPDGSTHNDVGGDQYNYYHHQDNNYSRPHP